MEDQKSLDTPNVNGQVESKPQDGQAEMTFFVSGSDQAHVDSNAWYQDNPDVLFPLIVIGMGLFQYVLRKWILPVNKDLVFDLEDQSPGQGILLLPGFGVFVMIIGVALLVIFNFDDIF